MIKRPSILKMRDGIVLMKPLLRNDNALRRLVVEARDVGFIEEAPSFLPFCRGPRVSCLHDIVDDDEIGAHTRHGRPSWQVGRPLSPPPIRFRCLVRVRAARRARHARVICTGGRCLGLR